MIAGLVLAEAMIRTDDLRVWLAARAVPAARSSARVATIRTEYRLVPLTPVLRFTCVSDLDEYREILGRS